MKKFVLFLVASIVFSQIPEEQKTHNFRNGRFWQQLSYEMKTGYVVGYNEAISQFTPANFKGFPFDATYAEIIRGVDQFYQTPENCVIPIPGALSIYAEKTRGTSAKEIDEITRLMRKIALQERPGR